MCRIVKFLQQTIKSYMARAREWKKKDMQCDREKEPAKKKMKKIELFKLMMMMEKKRVFLPFVSCELVVVSSCLAVEAVRCGRQESPEEAKERSFFLLCKKRARNKQKNI